MKKTNLDSKSSLRLKIKGVFLIIFGIFTPIIISTIGNQIIERNLDFTSDDIFEYNPFTKYNKWLYSSNVKTDFKFDNDFFYTHYSGCNQSYLVSQVSGTDFCDVIIDGPDESHIYQLSNGENQISLMHDYEWSTYTIKISEEYIEHIDYLCIQPFFLSVGLPEIEYSKDGFISQSDLHEIKFQAIGSISILLKPDFYLNQLYLKIDDYLIQSLHPWDDLTDNPVGTPMMPSQFFSRKRWRSMD